MQYEEGLKKYLKKEDQIKLAYLFGSVAQNKTGKLSDVDLAIYLDDSLNKKEKLDLKLKFISEIENIIKNNRLDMVIMNDAPIALNFEIIKANYPLLIRDEDLKVSLEQYIMSRYLDRQYYDQRWAKNLLNKLTEGS